MRVIMQKCSIIGVDQLTELPNGEPKSESKIGDRSSSDVIVRIRTKDGRDDWIYCHSHILAEKSKYFADRLSDNWPTCQILDSRNCVEVHCEEFDVDYHVNVLRLFYVGNDISVLEVCHGVRNTIGMLRVSIEIGCPQVTTACVDYLEAVPWEETEEEEILRIIPGMGSQAERVLARLLPVNPSVVRKIFFSAVQFAMSSPQLSMTDLKTTAQEQLEYMLTEDDDAPLLVADKEIKIEVKRCFEMLLTKFENLVESLLCDLQELIPGDNTPIGKTAGKLQLFRFYLADLSWSCQILTKLEAMKDIVYNWVKISDSIIRIIEQSNSETEMIDTKLKVLEVAAKVLESIGGGNVLLSTSKRLDMVNLWLPFARVTKPLIDSISSESEDNQTLILDGEIWQSLESAFVAIILTLPSDDQAEILTEWLTNQHVRYPDLAEAFEVWCYRSKVARRRLASLTENPDTSSTT